MQFKLGPFTMAKNSCLICTDWIPEGNRAETSPWTREARVCQNHGSFGYPHVVQCAVCKMQLIMPKRSAQAIGAPVPLNICFDCWGAGAPFCCELELD
jgi:hypothetical protein